MIPSKKVFWRDHYSIKVHKYHMRSKSTLISETILHVINLASQWLHLSLDHFWDPGIVRVVWMLCMELSGALVHSYWKTTIFNIIRWVAWSMGRLSDVPSINFFYNFLQNSFQKYFQFFFFFFFITLQKYKKRVLSALCPSQQPIVLFSIYQNDSWTIRR